MINCDANFRHWFLGSGAFLLACGLGLPEAQANPSGGTVVQGTATITSSGPQTTITTSDRAGITWQSFNIGAGETTTFVQPSSSSIVWNQINDANPSQILGNLNANGYVILENQSGFYVGGQASITTHGLVMSTAPIHMPELSGAGAWEFDAPPPTASIINYGQINIGQGGSAFLIAHDIENHGDIIAPQGNVGLCAGQQVLLSERPDGRGLSAEVTLPEGSVDNTGRIIADAGSIALHARVVNQGGLIQANSVREVNGTIELIASDAVNLGANSTLSAQGDSQGVSAGGSVIIKSANTFSDQAGSTINISGGAQGGHGGHLEISAATLPAIQSHIDGHATAGFRGGDLTLDPTDLNIDAGFASSLTPILNSGLWEINVQADNDITVSTVWNLADPGGAALLTLTAGNNIILNDGSAIRGGNNWSVSLNSGTDSGAVSEDGRQGGIYLDGSAFIETRNGNINLSAAVGQASGGDVIVTHGAIRTLLGGSITVNAAGNVDSGDNPNGYNFAQSAPPYYTVSPALGGISTRAGGDVTIIAGGNVTSLLPVQTPDDANNGSYGNAGGDAGTGAFGPQAGNVTISAGGNVTGHYVLANGTGSITAQNGNVGSLNPVNGFALSLVKGGWTVSAPNGNIYVQDIHNPNGLLNDGNGIVGQDASYPGFHLFDYDAAAYVHLHAGNSVYITGEGPHSPPSTLGEQIPILIPPQLTIAADNLDGLGGIFIAANLVLYPSSLQELSISTLNHGNFLGSADPNFPTIRMSDSAANQWSGPGIFGVDDHAPAPLNVGNPDPVDVSIAGNMENVFLMTDKKTTIHVFGDMINSSFVGENLDVNDVTTVTVDGRISYSPIDTFITLDTPITGANSLNPSDWTAIFSLLLDPSRTDGFVVPSGLTPQQLTALANSLKFFGTGQNQIANPVSNFIYDPVTLTLGFSRQMSASLLAALSGKLEIVKLDSFGNPVVQAGQAALGQDPNKMYFATTTVSFIDTSKLQSLYLASQDSLPANGTSQHGLQIGGPGKFNIVANSMDLGASDGIISWGIGKPTAAIGFTDFGSLSSVTPSGAEVSVDVAGDLTMFTSTIATIDGGKINVTSDTGKIDLGLPGLQFDTAGGKAAYGIYTAAGGDVTVTAQNDINIVSARIAAFNGGNIDVESSGGSVLAGNGANSTLIVPIVVRNPQTGLRNEAISVIGQGTVNDPLPFGSGIIANTLGSRYNPGRPVPQYGNITVKALGPQGDVLSGNGGFAQFALLGPQETAQYKSAYQDNPRSIDLTATRDINVGPGGVFGENINLKAGGTIVGPFFSQNNINADASSIGKSLFFGPGDVNLSAPTIGVITVIGIRSVNVVGNASDPILVISMQSSVAGSQSLGDSGKATATSQAAAQQASNDTKDEVTSSLGDDDDTKKKGKHPALTRRVGRVTVILPPA